MHHFASCKIKKNVKIIANEACFLTSGTFKISILKYCQLKHSVERNDCNDTLIMQDITKRDTLADDHRKLSDLTLFNPLTRAWLVEFPCGHPAVIKVFSSKKHPILFRETYQHTSVERYIVCSGMLLTTIPLGYLDKRMPGKRERTNDLKAAAH